VGVTFFANGPQQWLDQPQILETQWTYFP